MDILIATQNKGKLREYRELLADLPVTLHSPADVGLGEVDVAETGTTLEENATLKAVAFAKAANMTALADDTGLFVDAIEGRPGIYAARYGGPGATDADKRRKLLNEIATVPNPPRTARFECAIAIAQPGDATPITVLGVCPGQIVEAEAGDGGFGYDPIFQPDNFTQTFAEMDETTKNRISHRGVAVALAIPVLRRLIDAG